jgi:hypothetical protein
MTVLGKSYMPIGLTSNPSERGTFEKGYLTREAHPIDMIRFMAWSARNSEKHDIVVFNNQEHNYHILHGMRRKKARESSSEFCAEKVEVMKRLVDENGINVNVYDTTNDFNSSSFKDRFAELTTIINSELELKEGLEKLVPSWIKAKVNNDPKKVEELSLYALGELAYILHRADQVKVGHKMEKSYDTFAKYLVQEGFVSSKMLPSFTYPFESGMRISSDLPIEPYRVPDNPGARADRVLVTDKPADVRGKIEKALIDGKELYVKNYLEMVLETASMVSPKSGTTMDWLPEIAQEYLENMNRQEIIPINSRKSNGFYAGALALAASAVVAGSIYLSNNISERNNHANWMRSFISKMESQYPLSNKYVAEYVGNGKSLNDLSFKELKKAVNLLSTDDTKDDMHQMKNPDYLGLIKYQQAKKSV